MSVIILLRDSNHKSKALIMTLFQNDEFFNKPQYRDLFMIGDECLVKGIRFLVPRFSESVRQIYLFHL